MEPEPPKGVKESRDLILCHPELQKRYAALKADFEKETGKQLFETCTWRSPERQNELYQKGRAYNPTTNKWEVTNKAIIVTNCDGITTKSRHGVFPSEAIDTCVDTDPGPGKKPNWDKEAYAALGPLSLKHGLRWGGDWDRDGDSSDEKFLDSPHLELPAGAA